MDFFKKNFYVVVFALVISSCVDNPSIIPETGEKIALNPFSLQNYGEKQILDSLFPDMKQPLIALHNVSIHHSTFTDQKSNNLQAIFTNQDQMPVNVERVSMNNIGLDNHFDEYRYRGFSSNFTIPNRERNNIFWEVLNYQGFEYAKLLSMSKKIEFPNYIPFDTVDISNGLNFPYSGADSGEIIVELNFENELTANLVDPDSSLSGGRFLTKVPDNGKIFISADYLATLKANRIYSLKLLHFTYHEDNFSIGKVGYFTSYSSSIPLFLKR